MDREDLESWFNDCAQTQNGDACLYAKKYIRPLQGDSGEARMFTGILSFIEDDDGIPVCFILVEHLTATHVPLGVTQQSFTNLLHPPNGIRKILVVA